MKSTITFEIKLGNLHLTSMCADPRLWRLFSSFIIVSYGYVSRKAICPFVCVKSR